MHLCSGLRSRHSSGVRSSGFSSRTAVPEQASGPFPGARSHQLADTAAQSLRAGSTRRVSSRDALRCAPRSSRSHQSRLYLQTNTCLSAWVQLRRRNKGTDLAAVRKKIQGIVVGGHYSAARETDLDCLRFAAGFWLSIGTANDRPKMSL